MQAENSLGRRKRHTILRLDKAIGIFIYCFINKVQLDIFHIIFFYPTYYSLLYDTFGIERINNLILRLTTFCHARNPKKIPFETTLIDFILLTETDTDLDLISIISTIWEVYSYIKPTEHSYRTTISGITSRMSPVKIALKGKISEELLEFAVDYLVLRQLHDDIRDYTMDNMTKKLTIVTTNGIEAVQNELNLLVKRLLSETKSVFGKKLIKLYS